MKRVLYIQYTNPGGYPPLEHSSKILADAGWQVLFFGTGASGAGGLDFPPHERIRVIRMPFEQPGWRQKLHYLRFCLRALGKALFWGPRWVYASDPLSCPVALVLTFVPWIQVLYHEHDSPADRAGEDRPAHDFFNFILATRRAVARRAGLCVLPNASRLRWFETHLGPVRRSACVWNCPRRDEVAASAPSAGPERCTVVYHGSIVPARLPRAVIEALVLLPEAVKLRVTGYETVGSSGYSQELTDLAASLGVGHRVEFRGPMSRWQLMASNADVDVGLALTPMGSADANFQGMTGASNKAFDYMASGLPLVVSDLPDWRGMFVAGGFALAADPDDARSIAAALGWFAGHAAARGQMGEAARRKILADWNYETVFAPVLAVMSGDGKA